MNRRLNLENVKISTQSHTANTGKANILRISDTKEELSISQNPTLDPPYLHQWGQSYSHRCTDWY
jgi:hypothetical protein